MALESSGITFQNSWITFYSSSKLQQNRCIMKPWEAILILRTKEGGLMT